MSIVDEGRNDTTDLDDVLKDESKKLVNNGETLEKLTFVKKRVDTNKKNGKLAESILKTFTRAPLYFPQKLKEKQEKGKYQKYIYVKRIICEYTSYIRNGADAQLCKVHKGLSDKKPNGEF